MLTKFLSRILQYTIDPPSSQETISSKQTFTNKNNTFFFTWKQAILEISQKQGYTSVAL